MRSIDDIKLVKTCEACPEQYDAFLDGEQIGYLRLRHGFFRVEHPDSGGAVVYTDNPKGDGCFESHEREYYLTRAKQALFAWMGIEHEREKKGCMCNCHPCKNEL